MIYIVIIPNPGENLKGDSGKSLFKISSDKPNSVGFTNEQSITIKGWADSLLCFA